MTQTLDPVTRSISQNQPQNDAARRPRAHHSTKARGLSDRQAVIAVMIANGATCQDIAFELLLPLRTVQGHLLLALRVLNLSRVEDLTYAVIAAHQTRNLTTATTGSETQKPVEPDTPLSASRLSSSLVALDAAEASSSLETRCGDPILELAAVRAELDDQHRKVQQLHEAVESRDSIGQAKGILMERYKISAAAAFTLLQGESNRSNRKLADVAKALVFSGEESG